jgi:hypothetical protein
MEVQNAAEIVHEKDAAEWPAIDSISSVSSLTDLHYYDNNRP